VKGKGRADMRLVDDEQIGPLHITHVGRRNPVGGSIDDVNGEIGERADSFTAGIGVLEEDELRVTLGHQHLDRRFGMATGIYGGNPGGRQRFVTDEKLAAAVLVRNRPTRHHHDAVVVAQQPAQREGQHPFPAIPRAADANGEGARRVVARGK
jgi:hypothetical protein